MIPPLPRMPLSLKVPLLASALMVLVGVVASQQVLASLARVQDARIRELARQHVEGLSVAIGPLVLREDVWGIYDTLDRAARASDGARMVLTAVADGSGRVLAATDPRRAPLDSRLADLTEGAQSIGNLTVAGGQSRIRLAAPLDYEGRTVGRIATILDVSDLISERQRALAMLLLGNALATVGLAAAGYFAVRRMLRPITRLAAHMTETTGDRTPEPIAQGDLPRGDSELARLARTYNAMSEAVAARAEAERRLADRERFVSLGRLSSSLAHEINNPLGGLLNATDTIQRYADRPDVVRRSADLLRRGLDHLREVTRAALDHNRHDRSAAPLRPEDMDDLRLLIEPEVGRQGQTLHWRIDDDACRPPDLPAGPVRQIALNLLLNASAAAGPGGHVDLSIGRAGDDLVLTVADDGAGLPSAAIRRLTTSEAAAPGGGFGLRLVHDLASGLGGTISHDRSDGQTLIRVLLPSRAARRAAE